MRRRWAAKRVTSDCSENALFTTFLYLHLNIHDNTQRFRNPASSILIGDPSSYWNASRVQKGSCVVLRPQRSTQGNTVGVSRIVLNALSCLVLSQPNELGTSASYQ